MTKAQRAYTEQFVTVEQSPKQRKASSFSYTVYLVTHNPLMATERRKIVTTAKSYREAAIIARGYAQGSGIRLSSRVEVY
jgi:hypothetical protein